MYLRGLVMRYKLSFFSVAAPTRTSSRGFGLIELMVSISIMTLVSTVILVKNRSFNNALLLRNQAYEIAFTLRQAQLMAVSGNMEATARRNIYGVHLDLSTNNRQYRLYRDDLSNINWYDGTDATIGTLGSIDSNYVISGITNGAGTSLGNTLSVSFVRPNFDAIFKTSSGSTVPGPVNITISPRDTSGYSTIPTRKVEITSTGQITVK